MSDEYSASGEQPAVEDEREHRLSWVREAALQLYRDRRREAAEGARTLSLELRARGLPTVAAQKRVTEYEDKYKGLYAVHDCALAATAMYDAVSRAVADPKGFEVALAEMRDRQKDSTKKDLMKKVAESQRLRRCDEGA